MKDDEKANLDDESPYIPNDNTPLKVTKIRYSDQNQM